MYIMVLDVKATHRNNPDCPMRIARRPTGGWMCVDCGFDIIQTCINTHRDEVFPTATLKFDLEDHEQCFVDLLDEEMEEIKARKARRSLRKRTGSPFPPPVPKDAVGDGDTLPPPKDAEDATQRLDIRDIVIKSCEKDVDDES